MKHLKFLTLLSLASLFITSCQTDEIDDSLEIENQSEIELRSYNQEDCGFVDAFCEKRSKYVVAVHEPFEPCKWPCFTGGGEDGSSMRIIPAKIFDGSTAVFVEDENEAYFVINTKHRAFEGITIEREVPNEIRALLDIDYRDISDGTKLLDDIQSSGQVSISSVNNSALNINSIDGGGTVSALVRYCDYYRTSDVESFIDVFFDEDVDYDYIRDIVDSAFEEASNDENCSIRGFTGSDYSKCRYNCIDPRCIVDYLLDPLSFLDEQEQQRIVARYLGSTLNLTQEEQNWLAEEANLSFVSDLYNQLGTELSLGECENEDCSMRYSVETLIGLEMSGQTSTMNNLEQFDFYANLYCCDEPSLLTEVEDLKLIGYPNPTTDAILEGVSNMCCGENAMSQSEFASLMADQLYAELASIGESWPTSPDFFDNDFFEIMFEMMKEIVPELIPGVDTYIELKNAIEAYDNGNYWQSAESFALAVLTVTPADKCKDFVKVFKTGRKGFKIFSLFDKLKALDPLLAKGFKETLLKLQKNDHIFRKHPGHWPDLKNVTKAVGGKENLVFNVYKKVFDSGIINSLSTGVPVTFNITINGIHIRGTVIKLPNGTIRIDDFWIP